jgi:hypothetical protein
MKDGGRGVGAQGWRAAAIFALAAVVAGLAGCGGSRGKSSTQERTAQAVTTGWTAYAKLEGRDAAWLPRSCRRALENPRLTRSEKSALARSVLAAHNAGLTSDDYGCFSATGTSHETLQRTH